MARRYIDTTLTLLVKNRNITTASHVYVTLWPYIEQAQPSLTEQQIDTAVDFAFE